MDDIPRAVFDRPIARYALAVVVVAASFLLRRMMVQGFALEMPPFITFYPAVILVAVLAGLGPGLLATVLAVLGADYLIFAPLGNLAIAKPSEFVALAFFAVMGVLISLLAEQYRRSQRSIAAYKVEQALRLSNEKLEVALASMTDAAEEKVRASEALYSGLFNSMDEGFCIIEMIFDPDGKPADYRFLEVNAAFEKQTGLHGAVGSRMLELVPSLEPYWFKIYGNIALTGEPAHFFNDSRALHRNFEVSAYRVGKPELRQVAVVFSDITERRHAEGHIRQLNRTLSVLSDINKAIVREKSSQATLEAACRIAVDKGKFRMAWIGMVDCATQMLQPVASSGMVDGYLDRVKIDLDSDEGGSGPAALCFQSGEPSICNDIGHELYRPWKSNAVQHGYRSLAALPLRRDGQIVGVFCLYSGELAFFDDEEVRLLNEMAMDISFALEVNRREEERQRAEKHIRQLNRILGVLSDINQTIVRVKDSQTMLETACGIAVEKGGFRMAWIGMIDPVTQMVAPVASRGSVGDYLENLNIDLRDRTDANGPAARSIFSGEHTVCSDIAHDPLYLPWRDHALSCGYRSSAAFPLQVDGQAVGVFNLYSSEPGFFADDELSLLDEMAMDVSFALEVNRRDEVRRKAEEELRWRTAFFEAQVDSALDGILVVDGEGKKILQNQRFIDLMKFPREVAEDSDDTKQLQFAATIMKNPDRFAERVDYLNSHPDEVSRDEIELNDGTILDRFSAPVRDKALNYYGRIWTFHDITEQRQLEGKFRQAQKMEAVGQLTGGIAHDFNNLLTVIMGCAEVLGDELRENPRLGRMAEMTLNASRQGAELTHRMLAFARRQTLQPKLVNVKQLLQDMEGFLRRTLTAEIELDIIQGGDDCEVIADPTELESAVLNLCVNARDAMPGGGSLTIEADCAVLDSDYAARNPGVIPGQYILVAVSDTGDGIDPENLSRVFDPFFTTKEVGKGTGLGLSMVYGFVKQSQGHVKIYSEPGHGTSVKLYLPKATRKGESFVKHQESIAGLEGSESILLVEDNAPVREFAKFQLASLGYRVVEATNGKEALQMIEQHADLDLLFTDLVMPGGMNGRELGLEACRLNPGLKVLYCSGYAENAIVHQGLLDKDVQLLNKPYTRLDLARRIRKVLGKS